MAIKTRETNGTGVTNNGAPLTNAELDNNFIELVAEDANKLENVVEDTSPELGGDLDANDKNINFENSGALQSSFSGDGTNSIAWATALPELNSSSFGSVTGGTSIHQTYANTFWGAYDILEVTCKNSVNTGVIYVVTDDSINFATQTTSSTTHSTKAYINKTGFTIPLDSAFSLVGGSGAANATCARNLMFTRNAGSISFGDTASGVVVDQDNSYNTDFHDKRSSGGSHIRMLGAMADGTNQYALDIDFDSSNNSSHVDLFADGVKRLETTSTGVTIAGEAVIEDDIKFGSSSATGTDRIMFNSYSTNTAYHAVEFTRSFVGFDFSFGSSAGDKAMTYGGAYSNRSGTLFNSAMTYSTSGPSFSFTGSITASGDVTAFSDARLKENVETIDNALEKVCGLRGVSYEKDGKKGVGVIAQEVEEVVPEVVGTHDDKDATRTVAYGNMVGVLIEAIKEQQQQIEDLKAKVTELGGYE